MGLVPISKVQMTDMFGTHQRGTRGCATNGHICNNILWYRWVELSAVQCSSALTKGRLRIELE